MIEILISWQRACKQRKRITLEWTLGLQSTSAVS